MVSRIIGTPFFLMKKSIYISFLLLALFACKKDEGELISNQSPNTVISIEEINLEGDSSLNSLVSLSWSGFDADGYIKGFEISLDNVNWNFTKSQDSTFLFSIPADTNFAHIDFYVRAIDNLDTRDETPDYLRIPIKNSIPTVAFDENLFIPDSVFIVATTAWSANDADGIESITNVQISINGNEWFDINKNKETFSIAPTDPTVSDTVEAYIYYDTDVNPSKQLVKGLIVNDTNKIFIRAIDQSGAISKEDTSLTFYLKGKQNDVLVVGGVSGTARTTYASILNNINLGYDFLDLLVDNGVYRPSLWNTTFRLQLSFYKKLFFYSDESILSNDYTGVNALLLEFAASSLQQYANAGGKYFISTKFNHNQNIDGFTGVLPLTSVSTENYGDARLFKDSVVAKFKDSSYLRTDTIVTTDTTIIKDTTINLRVIDHSFPVLGSSKALVSNIGVFNIDPLDTEILYEAQLGKGSSPRTRTKWADTQIVGSGRRVNGKLNQVYFSIQLWELDEDIPALEALFDKILNVEFN